MSACITYRDAPPRRTSLSYKATTVMAVLTRFRDQDARATPFARLEPVFVGGLYRAWLLLSLLIPDGFLLLLSRAFSGQKPGNEVEELHSVSL